MSSTPATSLIASSCRSRQRVAPIQRHHVLGLYQRGFAVGQRNQVAGNGGVGGGGPPRGQLPGPHRGEHRCAIAGIRAGRAAGRCRPTAGAWRPATIPTVSPSQCFASALRSALRSLPPQALAVD